MKILFISYYPWWLETQFACARSSFPPRAEFWLRGVNGLKKRSARTGRRVKKQLWLEPYPLCLGGICEARMIDQDGPRRDAFPEGRMKHDVRHE